MWTFLHWVWLLVYDKHFILDNVVLFVYTRHVSHVSLVGECLFTHLLFWWFVIENLYYTLTELTLSQYLQLLKFWVQISFYNLDIFGGSYLLEMSILNFNLGVLGHVDSGKTSLVKALSSVASTACFDKNPQSKERGITLDLGFSSFTVDFPQHLVTNEVQYSQLQFTLVDCPGHASLIKTIIGGLWIPAHGCSKV